MLEAISLGGSDGELPDIDQILTNLSYDTTKESLQFSIRKLVEKELIEKKELEPRRGKIRRVISLTQAGYEVISFSATSSIDL